MHEFGHFITAKLSGVRVNEFAIGMGPAIFKKTVGETKYALRILPIGGFCAMEGEDADSEDPKAFNNCPIYRRILIVVAGSLMNLLMGVIVLSLVFAPVKEWYTPTVESVAISGAADPANLMAGDRIVSVNDYKVYIYSDIFIGLERGSKSGVYDIEVERGGERVFLGGLKLTDDADSDDGAIYFVKEKTSFSGKLKYIMQNAYNLVRLVKTGLVDLITGNVSTKEMSGPVGIGKVMAETARDSMRSLWYLFAFISINLGIMNLLPIPALDGGRLVFLLIELIFGKPVPPKYEGYVHAGGLVVLMLFMLFVTFNDIAAFFR